MELAKLALMVSFPMDLLFVLSAPATVKPAPPPQPVASV